MMERKRENKNRPREESAKKPVPVFREVFQVKKKHARDPRFDDLSGSFDKESFEEHYSFLDDIKRQEKEELEKELKTVGDDQKRRKKILFLLQRIKNQERSKQMEKQKRAEELQQREEVVESLKAGKKPFIPKKSEEGGYTASETAEIKKKKLVETYQALQKSGKLEKYMEKKRRKMFSKDKKRFYK